MSHKKIVIIAGPNGAGKTTFARVEARVLQGGHDIPEATIRRRYAKGYENFLNVYQADVNFWQLFDNSGLEPKLIDEGANP